MSTYTIGQVADRTGFATSALRYYDDIGLVTPMSRTDSGYRVYDDQSLARLSFIDRAKRLGCSLEEITDLVALWEGDRCGPVQRRIHDLVTAKIADTDRRIGELIALKDQLRTATEHLAGPAVDGPCNDGCACLTEPAASIAENRTRLNLASGRDAPVSCTLDAADAEERVTAWRAVLDHATSRTTPVEGTLRIEFGPGLPLSELTDLAVEEQACCAFFSFAVTVDQRGTGLEVTAPTGAEDIVAMVFGERPANDECPGR